MNNTIYLQGLVHSVVVCLNYSTDDPTHIDLVSLECKQHGAGPAPTRLTVVSNYMRTVATIRKTYIVLVSACYRRNEVC